MCCPLAKGASIGRKLTIYTDGAARGNPGHAASGFMVYEEDGRLASKDAQYIGKTTNNHAEYMAIILALKWCTTETDANVLSLAVYCDNELVIRQLNGEYKIKAKGLRPLYDEVKVLSSTFRGVKFNNVRRENAYISAVDRSLNVLLDERLKSSNKQKTVKL